MSTESIPNMKSKAAFFHTTIATVQMMKSAFEERYPEASLISMLDDSILPEVLANENEPTPGILRRLIQYGQIAAEQGAGVFVCMCTTLGMMVRQAQKAVSIPMITIDGPMLKECAASGGKTALIITFAPTEKVSGQTARAWAQDLGTGESFDVILAQGAREALNHGDKALHDRIIEETIVSLYHDYDRIACAQVSMTDAAKHCLEKGMQVLYPLDSGIRQLEQYL